MSFASHENISVAELEALVEASADIMFKISETGKILSCRVGKFSEPLWSPEEFLGKEVKETALCGNNPVSFAKALRKVSEVRNAHRMEYFVKVPDMEKWYEVRMVPSESQEVLAIFKDITAQKKAHEEKLHTEALFKAIFDNTYQFTALLSKEGTLLQINQTALNFGGIELQAIQGKPFWDAPWWNVPDNYPLRLKAAIRSAAANNFIRYEAPVRGGDGKIYHIDFSLKAITDELNNVLFLIAEGRDISERKKIEDELNRSRKMYRTMAQNIPRGMLLVIDKDMKITLAEGEILHVLGYKRDEIEGKTLFELSKNKEIYDLLYKNYMAGFEGRASKFEFRSQEFNVFYNVIVQPLIKADKKIDEVLIIVYDVLEQKKMAAQLENNLKELQSTVKSLEQKNEQLEQFAYISSHDLQEPLRMVVSYTQLLEQKLGNNIDSEAKEFMNFAREGAQRMQQIIYDLLLYNDLDNNIRYVQKINTTVALRNVIQKLTPEIEATGAQIAVEELPDIITDAKEFVIIIEQLLSNAMKFVGYGVSPQVRISANETEKEWVFCIRDNGIGIKSHHFNRIFNIFQRLHNRGEYQGSGIGLAICKKIINLNGGNIWVKSQGGAGCNFYFSFPKP